MVELFTDLFNFKLLFLLRGVALPSNRVFENKKHLYYIKLA